ncbi:MAG TPA: 6-bladed beta-propeller, partial [Longimicrobium sp.]|nr:6-bladed beta-propeller [Longimicrobium sp.]
CHYLRSHPRFEPSNPQLGTQMPMRSRTFLAALASAAVLSFVLSGCGASDHREDARASSLGGDSAAWRAGSEWRLVEAARIGADDADGPYAFANIIAIALDPLERVWVADGHQNEIRVFDAGGKHVRTIGRKGSGPAEFNGITGMAWARDGNLWVQDGGNARFAVYDTAGKLVTTRPRPSTITMTPWPGGFDAEGRLYDIGARTAPDGSASTVIVRSDGVQPPSDTFALPAFEEEYFEVSRTSGANVSTSRILIPFTGSLSWALSPTGHVWVANTSKYRIERHAFSGGGDRVVERKVRPVPVTAKDRDGMIQHYEGFIQQGGKIDVSRIPDHQPALNRFFFDDTGNLWVNAVLGRSEPRGHDVFDPSGTYLGRVKMPVRAAIKTIQGDRVAAVATDSLDVQSVVLLRIVKPGA